MSTVDQTPDRTLRTGSDGTLARAKSTLITAMVFDVLAIAVNVIGAFNLVGATYGMATEDHLTGVNLYFGYLADGGLVVFFIAAAVLSIAIAFRIWRMLDAANRDDLEALKRQSSLGWAVIAIFAAPKRRSGVNSDLTCLTDVQPGVAPCSLPTGALVSCRRLDQAGPTQAGP